MAPKKQMDRTKTSDEEYDVHKSADEQASQRRGRRSTRRQRAIAADTTLSGDQSASPESKKSKIVVTVATKGRGKKPESGGEGEVRYTDDGAFEYYDPKTKQWVPAAYHNDHRQELIEDDAPQDCFDWAPRRGFADFDETSHMDIQRPWSGDHLEAIVDPAGKKVMFDLERPRLPKPADPGNWMLDDKVLLDHNNRPVKAWTDLNKTLSTEIEDWRLEAIRRLYWWLTMDDIVARMPHFRQKTEGGAFVPLQSSRAFTNRAMRFRQPKAIIPTNQRKGTNTMTEYFRSHLKKHQAETAEEVPELTPAELKNAKRANRGKFSMNSRYSDENYNASKSGNTKRKAEDDFAESADSGEENIDTRAKRVKKEAKSPPSNRIYAPLPTPHGWHARNRTVSESGQSLSQDLPDPEMALWIPWSEAEERDRPLIPLFVSLDCEELAAIQDASYITPQIVLEAKANGCTMLGEVEIGWFRDDVEREIDENGIGHPYVVMREEWVQKNLPTADKKDDDDCGSMGPNASDGDRDAPHSPTASEIARSLNLTQPPTNAPVVAPTSPQVDYTLGLDDAEAQLFENPWRHHYGPFGF